jgi:hypothetical protein
MRTQHLVVGSITVLLVTFLMGVSAAQSITSSPVTGAYSMPPGPVSSSVPSLNVHPAAFMQPPPARAVAPPSVMGSPSDRFDFGNGGRAFYSNPTDSYPTSEPSWLISDLMSLYPLGRGWEVEAGGFYMERFAPNGSNIVIMPPVGGGTLFDPGSLDLGWEGGVKAEATKQLDYQGRRFLNIAYQGSDGWDYHQSFGPFVGVVNGLQFGGNNLTIDSSARLYSAEVNLVTEIGPHLSVLAGYRWVETGDDITAKTVFAGQTPVPLGFTIDTMNQMHGFQIGALAKDLWGWRNVRLSADAKAGVYSNLATVSEVSMPPGFYPTMSKRDREASFLGEVGVDFEWTPVDWFTTTVGYEAICIDGVAMSVNQAVMPTVHYSDTSFYHGMRGSAVIRW